MYKMLNFGIDSLGFFLLIIILAIPVTVVFSLEPKLKVNQENVKENILGSHVENDENLIQISNKFGGYSGLLLEENRTTGNSLELSFSQQDNESNKNLLNFITIRNISKSEVILTLSSESGFWVTNKENIVTPTEKRIQPEETIYLGISIPSSSVEANFSIKANKL